MKEPLRYIFYLAILANLFLLNLKLKDVPEYAKSYDLSLENAAQYNYTIMTAIVQQSHFLGRHPRPTLGCDLCYSFKEKQNKIFHSDTKLNEAINTSKGVEDLRKKLGEIEDD